MFLTLPVLAMHGGDDEPHKSRQRSPSEERTSDGEETEEDDEGDEFGVRSTAPEPRDGDDEISRRQSELLAEVSRRLKGDGGIVRLRRWDDSPTCSSPTYSSDEMDPSLEEDMERFETLGLTHVQRLNLSDVADRFGEHAPQIRTILLDQFEAGNILNFADSYRCFVLQWFNNLSDSQDSYRRSVLRFKGFEIFVRIKPMFREHYFAGKMNLPRQMKYRMGVFENFKVLRALERVASRYETTPQKGILFYITFLKNICWGLDRDTSYRVMVKTAALDRKYYNEISVGVYKIKARADTSSIGIDVLRFVSGAVERIALDQEYTDSVDTASEGDGDGE